jgi:catalase
LKEAPRTGREHSPVYQAALVREKINRQNNFKQAGETYRNFEQWERDELVLNLVNTLAPVQRHIQEKMIELLTQCDADYGRSVSEGLKAARSKKIDRGPIGSTDTHKAVKQAEHKSKEAKQY